MKQVSEIRDCMTCDEHSLGCEDTCVFQVAENNQPRLTLLKKRKAMKAEKANGVKTAQILVSSAKKNKGQKNLYETPKRSYVQADKTLEKHEKRREKRLDKNVSQ